MEIIFNKQVIEIVERFEKMSPSSNPLITTDVKRTFYLIDKIVTKKDAENDNLDCFFNTLLFIQNRVINFLENATEEEIDDESVEKFKSKLVNEMINNVCIIKLSRKNERTQFIKSLIMQTYINALNNITCGKVICADMHNFSKALSLNAYVDDKPTYMSIINLISIIVCSLSDHDALERISEYTRSLYIKKQLMEELMEGFMLLASMASKKKKKVKYYAYEMYNAFMLTVTLLLYSHVNYYDINPSDYEC